MKDREIILRTYLRNAISSLQTASNHYYSFLALLQKFDSKKYNRLMKNKNMSGEELTGDLLNHALAELTLKNQIIEFGDGGDTP